MEGDVDPLDSGYDNHVAMHNRLHYADHPKAHIGTQSPIVQARCKLLTAVQLTALVIGSCVTCTDPILSQAIAKGPFADKYVARDLREIISSEAGANDGFGFPFLMLATYLLRHANGGPTAAAAGAAAAAGDAHSLHARAGDVGRQGGGIGVAMQMWFVETWLYIVLMSVAYGAVCGYGSCKLLKFCLRKYVTRHGGCS